MTLRRLLALVAVAAANVSLGAANLHARTNDWRYCNCISPPNNCCIGANACNGCITQPPDDE